MLKIRIQGDITSLMISTVSMEKVSVVNNLPVWPVGLVSLARPLAPGRLSLEAIDNGLSPFWGMEIMSLLGSIFLIADLTISGLNSTG